MYAAVCVCTALLHNLSLSSGLTSLTIEAFELQACLLGKLFIQMPVPYSSELLDREESSEFGSPP